MNYETFISVINKTSRVKIRNAIKVIEQLYNDANDEEDSIDEYCKIYDLYDFLLEQSVFEGDEFDFHNLAIVCARQDDYLSACKWLDKGLEIYPFSIDLLSDYLNYGMQCNKIKECNNAYNKLLKRKDKWNWRAYKFSIDYLIALSNIDCSERDSIIEKLIVEFQRNLPYEEDAYLVEAEYLYRKNIIENDESAHSFVSVLTYVTSDKCKVKRIPKCALKLADYYYDTGKNIETAIQLIERCKKDSVETQRSINREYVYLLSSLCYITRYYEMISKGNCKKIDIEKTIKTAYHNYHIAALNMFDLRVKESKKIIESIVRETGIAYPFDDGIENDF